MRDLTPLTDLHRSQLEAELPFIWLYELQTKDDPPQRYRLTNFTDSVQFGQNSAGEPLIYTPAPIVHGTVEATSDGSLPTLDIQIANTGPMFASTIDAADGYVDCPVRILLVSSLELSNPDAAIIEEGVVQSVAIKRGGIVFKVSAFNLYQQQFPPFIYSRRRCRWMFGSAECGYNASHPLASYVDCNQTVEDCDLRGADEEENGLTRLHPARFGGWPGIPRAGRG